MTKKTEIPAGNDVAVQDEALTFEQHIDKAVTSVRKTDVAVDELRKHLNLTFTDISDRANYFTMVEAEKTVRNIRYAIERRRKEIVEPANKFQKAVNAAAKEITADVEPIELHLKAEIQKHDNAEEAFKSAEQQRKIGILIEAGFKYDGMNYVCGVHIIPAATIGAMEDGKIEYYKNEATAIMEQQLKAEERRQAELRQLEEDRRKADQERRDLEAERAELARMREELEAAKKAADPIPAPAPEPQAEVQPEPNPFSIPAQSPIHETENNFEAPEQLGHNTRSEEYIDGFEHCRMAVLDIFATQDRRTRSEFIAAIKSLQA